MINHDKGSENEEAPYPQRAPLTELEHAEHAVLKLHRAVELGQVVIIDPQQLRREPGEKMSHQTRSLTETLKDKQEESQRQKKMIQRAAIVSSDRWTSYSVEFNPLVLTEVSLRLLQLFQNYRLEGRDKTQTDTEER